MVQASDQPAVGEAVYVYCFSLPGISTPPGPGVDENQPITIHTTHNLSAAVCWVSLDDFTGESGESNLQDIAWLGPRACRHAIVVEQVMDNAPVFPLPFGTLFSSLPALDLAIDRRFSEVSAALERVAGCQEWSVEATLDRFKAIDYRLEEDLRSGRVKLPEAIGRRHLEEQKLRRQLSLDLDAWINDYLNPIKDDLASLAHGFRPRRLTDNKVSHWAFLIPINQVETFRVKTEQMTIAHEPAGLSFRVTGPWPPYTFCQTAS